MPLDQIHSSRCSFQQVQAAKEIYKYINTEATNKGCGYQVNFVALYVCILYHTMAPIGSYMKIAKG